jgi:hypothetical protein
MAVYAIELYLPLEKTIGLNLQVIGLGVKSRNQSKFRPTRSL